MLLNNRLLMNSLIKCKTISIERHFWQYIINTFNKPDPQRIEAVGADRAAAEWLLKNGASVKWSESKDWIKDYNSLPNDEIKRFKITAIDGTDSSITAIGFNHLKGLQALEEMVIKNNGYIDDKAIEMLGFCSNSLKRLQIISCIGVTDNGIKSLTQLKNLNYLKLFDLPSVEDKDNCLSVLKSGLNCEIVWKEVKPRKQSFD